MHLPLFGWQNPLYAKKSAAKRRVSSPAIVFTVVEICEPRLLLSAIAIESGGVDEHWDAFGNEYEVLSQPDMTLSPDTTGDFDGAGSLADLAQTFSLHSNPNATHTIYLDFDGEITSGTYWNSSFNGGADIVTQAFDFEGGTSTFTNNELTRIQYIWQRVAEDFLPFDVDVTTEDPGAAALTKSGGGDTDWGIRVLIGGDGSWYGSAGGVAYIGSFNWSTDTPAFVFEDNLANGNEKYTAEAISHEIGHTLGLYHDGTSSASYYTGAGSWAPIMGVGYYRSLTQWSSGEYPDANNTEDDLSRITSNNGFGYRVDDYGNSAGAAGSLTISGTSVTGSGIIETNTDKDVFAFTTGAGTISFDVSAVYSGPNLDVLAELYDVNGNLVASANPSNDLGASFNAAVGAGTYYLHIDGVGEGDPLSAGYSDYGSLGGYRITGTIIESMPDVTFEAESDLYHQIGRSDGDGWSANVMDDQPGFLSYGPYRTDIQAGRNTASFRLLVDNNSADNHPVVSVDVFDATSGRVLAGLMIHRQQFNQANVYQNFNLEFVNDDGHALEFRVYWHGTSYVQHDLVSVTYGPDAMSFEADSDFYHLIGRYDSGGWSANVMDDQPSFLSFGPYRTDIAAGGHTASFKLQVDNNSADNHPVVSIDVVDATSGTVLTSRMIKRQEFTQANVYQNFDLSFTNTAGHALEFRTFWHGTSYVRQDSVMLTDISASPPVSAGTTSQSGSAMQSDAASDLTQTAPIVAETSRESLLTDGSDTGIAQISEDDMSGVDRLHETESLNGNEFSSSGTESLPDIAAKTDGQFDVISDLIHDLGQTLGNSDLDSDDLLTATGGSVTADHLDELFSEVDDLLQALV